jgi:hypothetical protein
MSVVVGYHTRDGLYFAADHKVTSDDGHQEYTDQKIFVGKDYLIGVAGDYKVVNLMEHFSIKWPKGDKKKFIVTELPIIIREYLEPYRSSSGEGVGDEYSILVGFDGGIYEVTDTLEASFHPVFHAIGTGAPYAFGAYHASSYEFDTETENVLTLAVGAANRYNAYCGGGVMIEKLPD